MKRLIGPAAVLLLTVVILSLAAWLPHAIFAGGQIEMEHPAADRKSPVGIEKCQYLGRAMSSSEEFIYESKGKLAPEKKSMVLEKLFFLVDSGQLPEFLIKEMQVLFESAVVEQFSISTVGGAELSLIHCYYEWTGDWSNWLESYIDEDTGKILYIYLSGSCINNGPEYASAYPEMPSLDELRDAYTSYMGYTMLEYAYSQNPNQNALTVTYTDGASSVKYLINRIYYAGTMYDIKIAPQP